MINITDFAIRNARLTILLLVLVAVAGVSVFLNYPSREDPSIVIRNANVTTQFPGMSPERVEALITKPIEKKLREIPEILHITSTSKTGVSLVKVTVKDDVADLAPVWQDLRDKAASLAGTLPSGTIGPTVNDQVGLTAIASIALWADGFSLAEMKTTADHIQDRLNALEGVQKIELYGAQEERIYLEISRAKISQYGISPQVIADTLRRQNIILPGGVIEADGQNVILEPSGNFTSLDDIENVLFAIPNTDQVARLKDLVAVKRGYVDPPRSPVYFNGRPAIVFGVSITEGVNSVHFGQTLKRRIGEIQQSLPWGYVLEFATFQPDQVAQAVDGAVGNLYQTLGIVLGVVIVFLGLRTGLIVGAFVPFTMLAGIVIMRLFDVELQRVSIAAMIIALGMLVDNGIVMAEDIRSRMAGGMERVQAALAAGRSLAVPLLTSSLTTILFFVPMAMADGGAGEYTLSLAQVVGIVLLMSWFLALFMTPALCAWFMKVDGSAKKSRRKRYDSRMYTFYRRILFAILRHRFKFIALMLLLLVGSGYVFKFIGKEFFPIGDRSQYLIYLDLPSGGSVEQTDASVQRLTSWLSDASVNPDVISNVAYVAGGGPRFFLSLSPIDADPHRAFILVNMVNAEKVDAMLAKTRQHLLDAFPEVRGEVKKMWMGASEAGLFEVRVIGPNHDKLIDTADQIISALYDVPGMLIAKQDWENPVLKLNVEVDQARARAAGVSSEQVANALNTYLSGSAITDYRVGDTIIPIVLRAVDEERGALSALQSLSIYSSAHDTWVPLTQIADVTGNWRPGRILRRDQERTVTVTAKHATLGAPDILSRLQPTLDALNLPDGYRWEIGGEIEKQAEANGRLFANLPLALGLIIVLLVWQFNSFRKMFVILLTIPLVLVGATLGLITMQALFGFMVILGFFSLAGIIINNGIVLIDRIREEEERGLNRYDAIVAASIARLRPILVTSLTTVLGLLPLIVSHDPLFYAMASAMAFGLAVGTVLTLGFVPALYAVFYRVKIS